MNGVSDQDNTAAQYRSPLLPTPGAVTFQGVDDLLDTEGVAWHYGDPLTEQRRAHREPVAIDRSQRRVLAVTGDDAPEFLNNLLSQKLDDVADGYSASALDLDIQGHILHHADITKVEGSYYLDVPSRQTESLKKFLEQMVFWSQVEITETDLAIVTVLGEGDIDVPEARFVRDVDWSAVRRRDLALPRTALKSALNSAGLPLSGLMSFTAERVRAVEPELGVDLDNRAIPHEVPNFIARGGRAAAVHLNKGCYRGQETVARVENLGQSPRLLVTLQLDGSAFDEPLPGDAIAIKSGGRAIGRVGTVVHDCDYGPIALALVKRSALKNPQLVITPAEDSGRGEVAATVDPDSLPTDEGVRAGRAAVNRLRNPEN
ncbi:folate-binding protein YgfZ [Corynebacterium yudongzhengii]|uniref:Folate-binding protein n=1 Tax=Corynebacterium yudongzhengii TaxID=2080740 RepID=A0A2U1T5Q8_9CORY|nr:folate-binding protein YgfZ [Corynebacterium yudongzhengii]PWC01322.1 folate-binding protein [Corynebacterium yudongzhengii]